MARHAESSADRGSWLRRRKRSDKGGQADGDDWVAVVEGVSIDDAATGSSAQALRLVEALAAAGVEARQRRYVPPDVNHWFGGAGPSAADRIRIEVVVRRGDLERTNALLDSWSGDPAGATRQATQQAG